MNQHERCEWLIRNLQDEMPQYRLMPIPEPQEQRWRMLRSLMNIRMPAPVSNAFLEVQDKFLTTMTREKGIIIADYLPPVNKDERMILWQGDITRLKCDAIVNAANSQLLGCFSPCHTCIDNIIHTMAGVQLRLACADLMEKQNHEEPSGQAKVTPGFNLPCKYVIHTVGPIVNGVLTDEHERLLAACYENSLKAADYIGCSSIAFCCISTGVFSFPPRRAAEIAVETVYKYYEKTGSRIKTIFNVYKDQDHDIYEELLNR